MLYADFLHAVEAVDAVLLPRGFRRVDQAGPTYDTDEPFVVYTMDLGAYIHDYPKLGAGDLQIDAADVVVDYRDGQLVVRIEGDRLDDLANRFDCAIGAGPADSLQAAIASAARQLDRLLTVTHR